MHLLGPPVTLWAGQEISFTRRQVRALLYRLSTDLRPVSREQLCFLLWCDNAYTTARRNLTHLLTHLRMALPEPGLVDFNNEYVSLDPQRVWSDAAHLEKLSTQRQGQPPNSPGGEASYQAYIDQTAEAVNYYRGQFLDGFSLPSCQEFDTWIGQERRVYEGFYLDALLDLIDAYQGQNAYESAIYYANRYLEIDNLAESVHCKLIELYAAMGDLSAAERQFERCTVVFEQELGISPSPKTWAIYQSLSGKRLPGVLLFPQGKAGKAIAKFEIPFIGRENVLKPFEQAFNLARLGRGKVLLIEGEAGIGKTHLLQHIASNYQNQAVVLFSTCNPGMGDLPYQPVAEALRLAIESHAATMRVSPIWLAEGSRLLPELYSQFPDLPAPVPARPEEARRRLFEALYQLAAGLASRAQPLLLCLDDLQWADTVTLEWLVYLGNRLAVEGLSHVLVIGACRSEETQRMAELRHALHRQDVLEEYSLSGLETEEVGEILRHLLVSGEDNPALADRLRQISGGNPFFLIEVLRALAESRSLPRKVEDLDEVPIPKTVQEAVHQRLNSLETSERTLLETAAALRRFFTIKLMQSVIESSELEILERLEALTKRYILVSQEGKYSFCHELVRMVMYSDLSYDRQRFLHRLWGEALERCCPDEIALLAWHFEQSGESGKAAEYALQAGEKARKVFAFREALDFFSRALKLLKQEAAILNQAEEITANYRMQIRALSRRGSTFRALGDMQGYQNDFEEEARIAEVLGDEKALAYVHLCEANNHRWFCRYPQARACAEKALQMSLQLENRLLRAKALREAGLAARAIGDFDDAQALLREALQSFIELKETGYEIYSLCNLSELQAYKGDFSQAEGLAASALSRCEQAQLLYLRRVAMGDLGVALIGLGQLQQGRECLLTSLEMARQVADQTQEIFCLCHLGWLENRSSKPEVALEYLGTGMALAERLDSRAEQSRLYVGVAEAHRLLGNLRLAKSLGYKALELAKRHGRLYDVGLAQQVLAESGENL
ncbi:MAG: AAA family ATPase [Chloroflexota bacterium]